MLRKIGRYFREYKQFAFVLVAIIAALGFDLSGKDNIAHWILGVTATLNAIPLIKGMLDDLRTGKYGIDILAATAIITSVILKEYWAGIIIVLMLTGGESLEDYAEKRARLELDALLERVPKKAHLLKGRKVIDVPLKQLRSGDKLIIRPGEVVPVDAVILEGGTSFDESSLTGESLPVDKQKGDNILSGSVNLEGVVTVRALRTAAESQYEQIIELVKSAASTESPFVRLTDRYSIPFTIISFAIAGTVWAISGDARRFLEVIVVATPCPLLLAAPIALISGMSRAAKHGIIIKSGSALEKLSAVKTMAFDKTGTLTRGVPVVDRVISYKPFDNKDVLGYAAALEQNSNHILARAIEDSAAKENTRLPKAKSLNEVPGRGVSANVGGKEVLVGRLSFLKDAGADLPGNFKEQNTTATYVSVNGKLAGVITFKDELRPESSAVLTRLRKLGLKKIFMVTGDNKAAAEAIASKLKLDEVVADALPGDKVMALEAAKPRPVAFVGDGVNDAPVLTASDVGIALGARGSTAASESADVVIMLDDISQVAKGLEIAKKTFKIAQQAILIGIGMSIVLQFVFATGKFRASLGAAMQELVDVTVIFIALRAHGSFRKSTGASKVASLQPAE